MDANYGQKYCEETWLKISYFGTCQHGDTI